MATMISGLGGFSGYGENSIKASGVDTGDLDDGSKFVDITSVFSGGINFFGTTYSGLYINTNGILTFESAETAYSPSGIAGYGDAAVAPFWTDIDISKGGDIYWDLDPVNGKVIVTWLNVAPYSGSGTNSFQVVLTETGDGDFDLEFIYESVGFTDGGYGTATTGVTDGASMDFELEGSGNAGMLANYPSNDFDGGDPVGRYELSVTDGLPNVFSVHGSDSGNDIGVGFVDAMGNAVSDTANHIDGGSGADSIAGGLGDDTILGGSGDDTILSGTTGGGGISWTTVTANANLNGTTSTDYYSFLAGTGQNATIRFNNSPGSGDGDGIADFVRVETTNQTGTLTIGDFDMGTDKIVLQQTYQSINVASNAGYYDVQITYSGGNTQSFRIYSDDGFFNASQVFTLVEPSAATAADADSISGGDDADTFVVADLSGNDTFFGGEGGVDADWIDLATLTSAATVTFSGTGAGSVVHGSDTIAFGEVEGITGTDQADILNAGVDGGGVTLDGGGGNDTMTGGGGADTILGGGGADSVFGGAGDDILNGNAGDDLLQGGDGADTFLMETGFGSDTVEGGEGGTDRDRIDASALGAGITILYSGDEAGTITQGADTIVFSGVEEVVLSAYGDSVDASAATAQAAHLDMGAGDDTVTGTDQGDTILGGIGNDSIAGGAGADFLKSGQGQDTLDGGDGDDTLMNAAGDDCLVGGAGDDLLVATQGNDTLEGGAGNDTLMGGTDGDSLDGGEGDDLLLGDLAGVSFNQTGTDGVGLASNIDDFPTTQLSYEITFASSSTAGFPPLASYATSGDNHEFRLDAQSGTLRVYINGSAVDTGVAESAAFDGAIHTLGVSWNSADGALDLYLDGVGVFSGTHATGATLDQGGTFVLGQEQDSVGGGFQTGQIFEGTIYGVRLYDDIRTPAEMLDSALGPVADTSDPNLVANWVADPNAASFTDLTGSHAMAMSGDVTATWSTGADTMLGGDGDDTLYGGGGNDSLDGGAGNDTLEGGDGDDVLFGGTGGGGGPSPLILLNFDDLGGTAADASGNGHDGQYVNGATAGGTGWDGSGTAAVLDGFNDHIVIPNDAAFELAQGTVSIRANPANFSDTQTLMSRDSGGYDGGGHFEVRIETNGSVTVRIQSTNTTYEFNTAGSVVSAGSWHHVAASFGSGGVRIYVDGVQEATTTYINGSPAGTTQYFGGITGNSEPWVVGGNQQFSGNGVADDVRETFEGSLDEFALFGSELDAASIADLEANGVANMGGMGDDSLVGGDGADTFVFEDGFGNDTVVGGEGGTDEDVIDLSAVTSGVTVAFSGDEAGTITDGTHTIAFSEVEQLVLTEDADVVDAQNSGADLVIDSRGGDDSIATGSGNDSLVGGGGADTLQGGGGDDTLSGGANDDQLTGGAGDDCLVGGTGDEAFYGDGGSAFTITVGGTLRAGVNPQYEVYADGVLVYTGEVTWAQEIPFDPNAPGAFQDVQIPVSGGMPDSVQIVFINDSDPGDGSPGGDRNLHVDKITVGGTTYEAETDATASGGMVSGNNYNLFGTPNSLTFDTSGASPSTGADTMEGGDGADTFFFSDGFGNDSVVGGEGGTDQDVIDLSGASGPVTVSFTDEEAGTIVAGTDTITFGQIERLILTEGSDSVDATLVWDGVGGDNPGVDIDARGGDDVVVGGNGGDTIDGGTGDDSIDGGYGDDILLGGEGNDTILGGIEVGDDFIDGGAGADFIDGGNQNDTLSGGDGNDTVLGGDGADSIDGGTGDDSLSAGADADTIFGGTGNDYVDGDAGDDSLSGGDGDDVLIGNAGNDTIVGGTGADTMWGGADADDLSGSAGEDRLFGENGNDTLAGGGDNDLLTGGWGNDLFLYSPGDGADTIADFNAGNSGALNDGDTTNNDFVDLSAFYDSLSELRADFDDDGVLNQSNATDSQGNAANYADNAQFGPGGSLTFSTVTRSDFTPDNTGVICFAADTLILTPRGEVPILHLRPGDYVTTRDNGAQPLVCLASRRLRAADLRRNPKLRPILLQPGALGSDRALVVSPQHGILVRFDGEERLVRATHLARLPGGGVRAMNGRQSVTYVHIVLDRHQIVFANGRPSESFFPGPRAMAALTSEAREELETLFPDLARLSNRITHPWSAARRYSRQKDLPPHIRALEPCPSRPAR